MADEPLTIGTRTNNVLALTEYKPFRLTVHEFARLSGMHLIAPCEECTRLRRAKGRDRTVWHADHHVVSPSGQPIDVEALIEAVLAEELH